MATATANTPIDMETYFDYTINLSSEESTVGDPTASQFVLVAPGAQVLTFTGSFVVEGSSILSGTITGITQLDEVLQFTATGVSVTITQLLDLAPENMLDVEALINFALRGNDTITGSSGADVLVGANGNDTLNGGGDNDTLRGGLGNDTLNGGVGNDALWGSSGNDTLDGSAGNDALFGEGNDDTLNGGGGNDSLDGGAGADNLNGGAGEDSMSGGSGGDTYTIDHLNDSVFEADGGGTDTVKTGIDGVTLATWVEKLILTGTGNINGNGNGQGNTITGNAGNNILDGGAGNDTLIGAAGNDTFRVDSTTDVIVELAQQGTDTAISTVNGFILPDYVENLTLFGEGATSGIGNNANNVMNGSEFANILSGLNGNDTINGNSGDDHLMGGSGNDQLLGGDGNDELKGEAGNDTLQGGTDSDILNGGAGNDTMQGGTGSDGYWVDAAGDVVTEDVDAGDGDIVYTSINWTLGTNFENLSLVGTGAINGTGNGESNDIFGNSGANTLSGLGGGDFILAYGGDDTIKGGGGDDNINGGNGNDTINGGAGFDTMAGGAGSDKFIFDTPLEFDENNSVIDFVTAKDKLVLDQTVFSALPLIGSGGLAASQFKLVTAEDLETTNYDSNDRILYESGTGNLYYDADGSGMEFMPEQFANISGGPTLLATDFLVVA